MTTQDLADLFTVLARIECGELSVHPLGEIDFGTVTYETPEGHRFIIYNDAGSFDYLDSVRLSATQEFNYEDLPAWRPEHPERWGLA